MSEVSQALCILFILLLPLALAGLALINTGLSRSRSAAHSMMATLCVLGVAAAAYFVTGFAWQGYPGLASHTVSIFGKEWSWLGAGHFFLRGVPLDGSRASLAALLQLMSVALAALIPLGAAAERWRLRACCVSTALLAGITYPVFAHWVWGGGWLAPGRELRSGPGLSGRRRQLHHSSRGGTYGAEHGLAARPPPGEIQSGRYARRPAGPQQGVWCSSAAFLPWWVGWD